MARKMKEVQPAVASVTDAPKVETLTVPPEAVRKVGRPSKAEQAARVAAERAALAMKPDEMKPLTILVLRAVAKFIKGDTPTGEEVDLVNEPATAVANKYGMTSRFGPEFALLGALIVVGVSMRERENRKHPKKPAGGEDAKRSDSDIRAEGVRQNSGVPLAVIEAIPGVGD